MRLGAAVGLIGVGLLLAGCGSGAVSGTPDPEGRAAGEPVFSPCDDIPDDALREMGLDPTTESPDIMGVKQPGWKICKWQGAEPALSVFSTTYTMEDVRSNKKNIEFNPVEFDGRAGLIYRETTDTKRRSCDVALAASGGAALISVSYLGTDPVAEDPCAVAKRRTEGIVQYIPE
ncbi:DUF3558 domain-containing protein [Rhodococcus sp. ABRD24]|uniref:DUF3558 domain-containing protein n=1 Tax=Rhodococcus sp. ABRD24 TaxID=2507582 RepID=UPI0010393BB2|nr:DUF3558 domain-containing protein [Rhodococcus sp. ABRD24]QBJ97898.1 DUF3558 domain-containing protein [Rhodococcus sp. ABRD24]